MTVMRSLSANGSRTVPRTVIWLNLRAIQPSRKSVTPTAAKRASASALRPWRMSEPTTGDATTRPSESTFGTVRIRSRRRSATALPH